MHQRKKKPIEQIYIFKIHVGKKVTKKQEREREGERRQEKRNFIKSYDKC